ncbi:MAG: glucose-1-phosphate adenylyltransferase [Negativicutes bacterium]|nr:glucose-1-phosphate adenylyltransferase [Negativicutes bacterium]
MGQQEFIALILAGGQGSRLSHLTKNLAKPAIPFGGRYRIIDFTLSNCYNSQVATIGILTQYQPFELHSHIAASRLYEGANSSGGIFILPPYTTDAGGDWYKGTADAVYRNIEFIQRYNPRYVLILSGDHVYKMDYRTIIAHHKQKKAEATIAVIEVPWAEASRFGVMTADADLCIREFAEKPAQPKSNLASMGIYVFNWPVLKEFLLADAQDLKSDHDFGKNIIPAMLQAGRELYAYPFQGYWMDVGTIESLWQANMDLLGDNALFDLSDPLWPIYSVDPAQPPHLVAGRAATRQSLICEGCQVYGQVEHSVIFPGVYVAPGAMIKNSVVMPNSLIGANAKITGCIIGCGANIANDCEIGADGGEKITVVGEYAHIAAGAKII